MDKGLKKLIIFTILLVLISIGLSVHQSFFNKPVATVQSIYVKGDKGDEGRQGERGVDGVTTFITLPGIPGKDGSNGTQGVKGNVGEKGNQGDTGEPGQSGREIELRTNSEGSIEWRYTGQRQWSVLLDICVMRKDCP